MWRTLEQFLLLFQVCILLPSKLYVCLRLLRELFRCTCTYFKACRRSHWWDHLHHIFIINNFLMKFDYFTCTLDLRSARFLIKIYWATAYFQKWRSFSSGIRLRWLANGSILGERTKQSTFRSLVFLNYFWDFRRQGLIVLFPRQHPILWTI